MLQIQKSIDLHNARVEKEGKGHKMTKTDLGRVLFPNKPGPYPSTAMNRLCVSSKGVKYKQVNKICELLGVDPNFLLGHPSKHDIHYSKLVTYGAKKS